MFSLSDFWGAMVPVKVYLCAMVLRCAILYVAICCCVGHEEVAERVDSHKPRNYADIVSTR